MGAFQIQYDLLVWESNIVREGFWAAAFALLRRSPLFALATEGKLAGCWVLKSPDAQGMDEPDKVLVRSYGVVSLSPATASQLGIDTSDGKAAYAMSGRQGIGIKVADLLDQMEAIVARVRPQQEGITSRAIAAAAIRYHLLKYALETEIVFDLDQAAVLHGNTGVYLLYAHARAAGILRKGGGGALATAGLSSDAGAPVAPSAPDFPTVLTAEERALLKHLATWPEVLAEAEASLAPQLLCTYAYELAALFHGFYAACPVLKGPAELQQFRLWLTERFRQSLAEALDLLGLPAPALM
jgi:arginyl-tRNA synthetase